ncbi:MAG TPA: glycosyltransferase family 4 protein [Spirochaetota bacterium]|nr:glycosyltransferase family 4 protein [Spirochaetota bacterium]
MKKKILMIVPLPPPITGQSYASLFLYEKLKDRFDIEVLNYSRKNAVEKSKPDFYFIKKIIEIGKEIKIKSKKSDIVYFTISQSILGNLKDLFFLFKMGKLGRKKTIIHLHGGYFDRFLNKAPFMIKLFNKILFKNIKEGVVLGKSLIKCLLPIIPDNRISVVPNFYDKNLRILQEDFFNKWNNPDKINILFLSNLMIEKGYLDLLEAFFILPEEIKKRLNLYFAGNFENENNKIYFLKKIEKFENIKYFGVVEGEKKKALLQKSHCFVLPTYVSFGEGQPISILESYASGLVVFTTDWGGIKDIFCNDSNGITIRPKSPESIRDAIVDLFDNFEKYKKIARFNLQYSLNFSEEAFVKNISELLEK